MNNINTTFTLTTEQQTALLKLTKTIATDAIITNNFNSSTMDCAELLNHGLVFLDKDGVPMSSVPRYLGLTAMGCYGYNNEDFNRTLVESFAAVDRITAVEFYTIQILHYLTTYRTNFTTPFIVGERTFTPEETKALKITIIRAESASESLERINDLFANTAAPKSQNISYYRALAPLTTIAPDAVKSRELMMMICTERNIRPEDPEMLFRYLVYRITGETLIIKNKTLITKIKGAMANPNNAKYITFLTEDEMKGLASIFYRYKPLFLAFKVPMTASIINKIRRLAVKYHKPQSVRTIKNFVNLNLDEQKKIIARASNRELIKLYNAVTVSSGTRLFQIRNGKIWVKEEEIINPTSRIYEKMRYANKFLDNLSTALEINNELRKRLRDYEGMTIYIPRGISYAVPYSEKQFSGVIPWGTKIAAESAKNAFTMGVHWVNDPDENHCDLDLHAHTPTKHLGWNSCYKSKDGEIIYSGDMTNAPAPKGAAESFYINNIKEPVILTLNAYSAKANKQFQFFITEGKDDEMCERATFDASKLISAPIPLAFADRNSLSLGIFNDKIFYVYGGNVAEGSVPSRNYPALIDGLLNRMSHMYLFDAFAKNLGINIVHEVPTDDTPFLDFSPEALTANTLLDFVDGNTEKLQFSTTEIRLGF